MIIASVYVLSELHSVSSSTTATLTWHVQSVDIAKQLQMLLYDENGYAQKYLITGDEAYFSLFTETSQQVDQHLDTLQDLQITESERSLVESMRQSHQSFVSGIHRKTDEGDLEHQSMQNNTSMNSLKALHRSLDHLISLNHLSIGANMAKAEATTSRSVKVALSLISLTLLTAITVAFIIARTLTRPIEDLIHGTEQLAHSRFEPIQVSSNDEIALLADAFNDMGDKIKKTNEFKTHMMQQISHELQTPLQAMLFAHDMIKEYHAGSLNDDQRLLLRTIRNGIHKIAAFRKQYLDLAKVESGVMEYNMEPLELAQVVKPLVDEAKLIAAQKNINLELTAIAAPTIMADAEKISVIANNLIGNAIKYAQKDGTVSIRIGPCAMGTQLEVQDSGIGIKPEELPRIFQKFYQADNAERIKKEGTGVGLALVKAFTEGHDGKIQAESSEELGSTFTVQLPAAPEEFQDMKKPVPSQP